MSRSKWKGSFITLKFLLKKKKRFKVWNRNFVIPSTLINKHAFVHNGKIHKNIKITREKVGFKFGEFSFTRTPGVKIKPKNKLQATKKK